ncbi:MAG: nitrilase-related carbon-nitrogen hydrolase [Cytophagales bacterium]|nr:nitrilase-related carbon-nitrogen hydrolase [Cytophagales bacterium]
MRKVFLVLLAAVITWVIWIHMDHTKPWTSSDLALDIIQAVGPDSSCGKNVVGIQPYMVPSDYLSETHFYEKMNGYFAAASKAGYFKTNTVVLLPEYIGTWLVIDGEKAVVADAETMDNAMALMILSNPVIFAQALLNDAGESDPVAASLFRMKGSRMAATYTSVFRKLAKQYGVTISAGSIVLPGPRVEDGTIVTDSSLPLSNTAFVFHPDGHVDPQIVKKVFPISAELPFTLAASVEEIPVFELPMGRMVVLVCADSWYPASYERISALGADVILVSSFCTGQDTMQQPWMGYDGSETPPDVNPEDAYRLTEREAWEAYALPARIKKTQASVGVNVFLRGKLWDLGTDGQPFLITSKQRVDAAKSDRGGIWNLCF